MCHSAQIRAEYKKRSSCGCSVQCSASGAFSKLYFERQSNPKIKIPKAVDALFMEPQTPEEKEIKDLIDAFDAAQTSVFEQELFKRRKRLADAQRALQVKPTKKAAEEERIATNKIEWARGKLADLRRTELVSDDSRIFPGVYAPVMVWEDGQRVIKPMRYQCRPAGKPAFYDTKYPGTYNALRTFLTVN
jgi:hypothetical protein